MVRGKVVGILEGDMIKVLVVGRSGGDTKAPKVFELRSFFPSQLQLRKLPPMWSGIHNNSSKTNEAALSDNLRYLNDNSSTATRPSSNC